MLGAYEERRRTQDPRVYALGPQSPESHDDQG